MLLRDKIAIVTGANRGIGRSITELFAENGCNVYAGVRENRPDTQQWMGALASMHGVFVKPVLLDLSDENSAKNLVREVMVGSGRIDVLVNNAGIASGALFQMTSASELRKLFDVNFFNQILLTQGVARLMSRNKFGSIINITSTAAFIPDPGTLAYGSSKAALGRAMQSMATELGPASIRVNAIAPSVTRTDMCDQMSAAARDKLINSSAMKRVAEPRDIANVALFLASDLSAFMTGQTLRVDGGIF
ncbi:MAG: SDR family NAD(P)-dependent oxidoreductase [Rhodoferax sp.]